MAESTSSTSSESHRNSVGSKSLSSSSSTSTSTSSNSHSDSLASLLPPPLSLLPINPPPLDELYSFAACNPTSDSDRRASASDGDRRESTGSLSSGSSGSNPKNSKNQKSSSESNSGGSSSSEGQNERRRSSGAVDLTPPTSPISRRITIKDRNKPLPQPPVAPISPPESNPRLSGGINDGSSKTSPITPSPSGVGLGLDLDPSKSNHQLPSPSFLAVFSEADEGAYDPKGFQGGRRRSSFLGLRRKSTSITPNGGSSPLLASPILGGFRSRRKVSMTDGTGDLNSSQEKLSKKESKESRFAKKRSFSTNTHQLQQPLRNPSTSNPGGSALGLLLGGAGAVAYGSPLMGSFGLEKDGKTSNQSSSETDLALVAHQQRGGSAALASLSIAPLPLDPSLEAAIEKLRKSVLVDSSSSRKPQSNSLTPAQTPKLSTSATSTPKIQQSQSQSPAISERNAFGKSEKLLESVLGDKKEASSPNNFGDLAFTWEEKKDGNSSRRWMGIKSNKIKNKSKGRNESDSPLVNDCSFTSGDSTAVSISNAQQSISDNLEASKRAMARLGWVYGSDQVKLFCGRDSKVNFLERLNLDKGNEISAILSDDLSSSSSSLQYRPKPILSPHSTLLRRWSNFTSIYFNSELSLEDLPSFPPPNVPSPVFCPFATPISSGPLSAVAPVWERERQLALDRLELHSLDSSTLEKITSLVMEAKESMKAADAVISILEGEETFVVSGESENGSTVKSPMERASTICGHTLFNRNKGQFVTNVKDDWRFAGGPSAEKWGFYSGMPICNANGMPIATLCTFDHEPRSEVRPSERAALRDIATRIGNELELAYASRYQAKLKRIQDSYSRLENLLIIDPPPFAQIVGLVSESKAETGIPVRIKLPRYHTQNQKREVKRIARDSSVAGTNSSTPLAALTLDKAGGSVLPFDQQKVRESFSAPSPILEPLGPEPKLLSLGLHVSKNNQERFDSITTLIAEALQLDTVYLVAFDRRLKSKLEDSRRSSSTKVVLQDPKLDSAPSPVKSVASLPTSAASTEASSPTKSKSEQPQPQKQNCELISYFGASISSGEELDPDLYRRVLSTAEAQGSEDVRGLVFQNRAEIGVDEKIGIGTFSSNKKGLWREASSLPGRRGSSDDGRVFTHQCGIFVAIEVETQAQVSKDPTPTEFSSSSPSVAPQDQSAVPESEPLKVGFVLSALSSSARRVLGVEDLRYLQAISSALGALILVCQRDGEAEKKKREAIKMELLKQEELLSKAKEAASQKFALRRTISLETTASVPTPSAFVKAPGISTKNRKGLNGKLGKGNLSLALPSVGMGMSLSSAKLSPRLSPRGTPKSEYCPTSPALAGQQGLGLSLGSGPKSKQQAAFESYSLGGEQSLDQETNSQLQPKKETMAKAFARKATGAAHTAASTASATASSALNFKMSSVTPSSLMLPTSASKAEKRRNRNSASPITPESAAGSAPLLSPKSLQPVFSYGYDLPDSVEAQEQAIWKRDMERVEKLSVNMGQGPRRASISGMAPLPSPLEFEPMGALWGGDGLKPSPRMKSSPKSKKSTPSRPTRLPPPRPDQEACLSPPLSPFASASTPPLDQDVNVDLPISPIWSSALLSPDPSLSETTSVLQSHSQMPRKEASRPSLRERRATSVFSLKVTVCDWSEGLNPESQSA